MGIAAYLVKPIRGSELLEAMRRALGNPATEKGHSKVITTHVLRETPGKLRILLAEDNVINRMVAVRLLEKRGHLVTVAVNGREVLAALEDPTSGPFDVVLMDVQMPEMDGFEATAAIRRNEKALGIHLPIVAMTAHAMKGDRERCLAAGMDGYVSKPIQAGDLFEAIAALVPAIIATRSDPPAGPHGANLLGATAARRGTEGDTPLPEPAGSFTKPH
jgi:CheY-like chemotaxis protein